MSEAFKKLDARYRPPKGRFYVPWHAKSAYEAIHSAHFDMLTLDLMARKTPRGAEHEATRDAAAAIFHLDKLEKLISAAGRSILPQPRARSDRDARAAGAGRRRRATGRC